MKYSIFLGCTIPARQPNYEISVRKTCEALGIELAEAYYGCCGFPVEAINQDKALAMSAMNLMKAEESGLPMMTLCSAQIIYFLLRESAMQDIAFKCKHAV